MQKSVCLLLFGNIKYDGRVQKEIETILEHDYNPTLIVSSFDTKNDKQENYSFPIINLKVKLKNNPIRNLGILYDFWKKAFRQLKRIKPEIVHCNDLDTLYAGHLYKKEHPNTKLIYDAHELFPESKSGLGQTFFWNQIEKAVIHSADEIIVPEKNRANYLEKKYKISKITILENFPRKIKIQDAESNFFANKVEDSESKVKILYLGAINKNRELDTIIKAFEGLSSNYTLQIVGSGKESYIEELKAIVNALNLKNQVYFHAPVSQKQVINVINSSDIGLVFYKNNNINNYYCASNKLFEFIACNIPVITNDFPGLVEIVKEMNKGICISKIAPKNIQNAIKRIHTHETTIETKGKFYWDEIKEKLLKIYNS